MRVDVFKETNRSPLFLVRFFLATTPLPLSPVTRFTSRQTKLTVSGQRTFIFLTSFAGFTQYGTNIIRKNKINV